MNFENLEGVFKNPFGGLRKTTLYTTNSCQINEVDVARLKVAISRLGLDSNFCYFDI